MNSGDFAHYVLFWLEQSCNSISYSTYIKYRQLIRNHIVPFFEENACKELNEPILKSYYAFMCRNGKNKLSDSNLRIIFMILNNALEKAYYERDIEQKLYIKPQLKRNKPLVRVLPKESQRRLEDYIFNNPNNYSLAILLALYSGMRIGELCSLQFSDIDFCHYSVSVSKTVQRLKRLDDSISKTELMVSAPKSLSANRIIPLPGFLIEYILELYPSESPSNYLLNAAKNKPLDPRVLQLAYKNILEKCDIPYLNFHCIRHTFATRCITLGWDVKTLSEVLGHSDIRITMDYYFHSTFEYKKMQMEKLTLLSQN